MTLEEMINWIADRDHLHDGPKIIAALRAGQKMYKDFDDNEIGYTEGQAAWDAATSLDEFPALGQEIVKESGKEDL